MSPVCDCSICKVLSDANTTEKLSYRRGTARRAMSVEIMLNAAQLFEKSHLKRLAVGELGLLRRSLKVIGKSATR